MLHAPHLQQEAVLASKCIGVVEAGQEMNRYPARLRIPPSTFGRRAPPPRRGTRRSARAYSGACWMSRSETRESGALDVPDGLRRRPFSDVHVPVVDER